MERSKKRVRGKGYRVYKIVIGEKRKMRNMRGRRRRREIRGRRRRGKDREREEK